MGGLRTVRVPFGVCSPGWWSALPGAGRLDEARLALEKVFLCSIHLRLCAEKIGYSGEALGSFPMRFAICPSSHEWCV